MITVQKLALAIQKRFGGTEAEALAESRTVMSYFGFRSVIIDNAIPVASPKERSINARSDDTVGGLNERFGPVYRVPGVIGNAETPDP